MDLNRSPPYHCSCISLIRRLRQLGPRLVIFDRGGTIMHRLAVDVAPVRPAKTMVKVFDIPETACSAIGSILVNDVVHCRDASGDVAGCVDRLSVSSKLAVSLLK